MHRTICKIFLVTSAFLFSLFSLASPKETFDTQWQMPQFKLNEEFDWIQTTSGEWVKGDLIALYDEELEFDSDEFGIQKIDLDDIAWLKSKGEQSIRMDNGTIYEGYIVIQNGQLRVTNNDYEKVLNTHDLVSIASTEDKEWDLWDGKVALGANFRKGNTEQFDYTLTAEAQRRTSTSRFVSEFVANFSESEDKETGESTKTANSQRLTAYYDWLFSRKVFFRAADFEYFTDELQNIKYRATFGVGLGYHFIDTSRMKWDITAGPSYQYMVFEEVQPNADTGKVDDTSDSEALMIGTVFEYEIAKNIDFETKYQVTFVSEESGKYLHHLETGFEIELTNDFDLDVILYVDRTDKPQPDESGELPEKDDYRLLVSLGYEF